MVYAMTRYEQTPIGEQGIIPGAEAITPSALARKLASEPLRAKANQLPADVGLFSDDHLQLDLIEQLQDPTND